MRIETTWQVGFRAGICWMLIIVFVAVPAGATFYSAPPEELPLVRVSTKSGSLVGELLNDDDKTVDIFDFQSNRSVTLTKTSVTRIENPITLDEAARTAGLPAVMGRKISVLSERQAPTGKIAKVSPQVVYLTLGESSGVTVGQKVSVFRGEGDIVDPDTGEVLASERARIAELEISEVNKNVSKARLIGDLEIKLEVGDEVEPQGGKIIVAVCPLSNDDGSANPTGNSLAEELVSALVQRNVSVVERSALDMVLSELLAQNTILFDQKSAQQLGKLTGASMVLTGKIIQEKSAGKAHLRLIDVQTGEILLAVSAPVKLTARSSTSTSSSGSRPNTTEPSSKKADIPQPSGEFEQLGKSRSLPKYLTTTAPLKKTTAGGIRFQGDEGRGEGGGGVITTKQRDFIDHDFKFEVLVSLEPGDTIAFVGIGPGRSINSRSRIDDSIYLRLHSPAFGNGEVNVLNVVDGGKTTLGQVPQGGIHMLRLIKEGDAMSLIVDPENDGPTDDDLELTIPDIKTFSPNLNSKNSHLFICGSGTFHSVRLEVKD